MNPKPEDMADVLTANLRRMERIEATLEQAIGFIWLVELTAAILIGVAAYYLLRKSLHA